MAANARFSNFLNFLNFNFPAPSAIFQNGDRRANFKPNFSKPAFVNLTPTLQRLLIWRPARHFKIFLNVTLKAAILNLTWFEFPLTLARIYR
jgi:hypothetical protein